MTAGSAMYGMKAGQKTKTRFITSTDGQRLAYDVSGGGPAIVLLHGGGGNRREWHDAGYVERLQGEFTVISVDLRGHGESSLPTHPADYTIDKMSQDILAAADACGAGRFSLWGMSFGGKVGRYLAAQTDRLANAVLMGTPLGPGVTGQLRQEAIDFCAHWPPIIQAQQAGALDPASLSPADQQALHNLNLPAMLGWVRAMLDWPAVEPGDFRCPVLWLIGSQDRHAMDSLAQYRQALPGSRVQALVLAGLDHEQVFEQIEQVFDAMLAFTRSEPAATPHPAG